MRLEGSPTWGHDSEEGAVSVAAGMTRTEKSAGSDFARWVPKEQATCMRWAANGLLSPSRPTSSNRTMCLVLSLTGHLTYLSPGLDSNGPRPAKKKIVAGRVGASGRVTAQVGRPLGTKQSLTPKCRRAVAIGLARVFVWDKERRKELQMECRMRMRWSQTTMS